MEYVKDDVVVIVNNLQIHIFKNGSYKVVIVCWRLKWGDSEHHHRNGPKIKGKLRNVMKVHLRHSKVHYKTGVARLLHGEWDIVVANSSSIRNDFMHWQGGLMPAITLVNFS